METTWIANEQKVIKAFGKMYICNEETIDAVTHAEWARQKLAEPAVIYPNGKDSHVAAGEILDKAEDVLLEHQLF